MILVQDGKHIPITTYYTIQGHPITIGDNYWFITHITNGLSYGGPLKADNNTSFHCANLYFDSKKNMNKYIQYIRNLSVKKVGDS